MKKLLQIGAALNCGAPGRITEQIGLLAMQHGWTVYQAHGLRHSNPSALNSIPMVTKNDERIHALYSLLLDRHGLGPARKTHQLVEWIEENKPDIIHLHNLHGYFLNFKVLFEYLGRTDIPIVWTLHDCWAFTGRCFHFDGIKCEKWKTGCFDCKAEVGYTVSRFCDKSKYLYGLKKRLFTSVRNMTLVPVSDWQAAFLQDSFLSAYPVHTIHNGVDVRAFFPMDGSSLRNKYKLENKYVILGVAAPWNARKGLYDFVRLREVLDNSFAIVLVGLKQNEIETLPKGIIGIERTESQKELAQFYSMADVFCNLTYLDTFPTVNLEALACGTPVITYKTGGSPEAIDEQTGIVVKQGDMKDLVDAVQRLRENPLSGAACRKRAETQFDKDKCFEEYLSLYEELSADR